MKHTKGPWIAHHNTSWGAAHKAQFGDKAGYHIVTEHSHGIVVASVVAGIEMSKEEVEANAQLIAQAPRLYKDLEHAQKLLGEALAKNQELGLQLGEASNRLTIFELFDDDERELALKAIEAYSNYYLGRAKALDRSNTIKAEQATQKALNTSKTLAKMADRFRTEMY